jgi:DNA transposition AAA+ family ATPase
MENEQNLALTTFGDDEPLAVATVEKADRSFAGHNVGGNTVTRATEDLPDDLRIIFRALHNYCHERRPSTRQLENEIGLSYPLIFNVWTDKYRHAKTITERRCNDCKKLVALKPGGACRECGGKNVTITEKPNPRAGDLIQFGKDTLDKLRAWKARRDGVVAQLGKFVEISVWERIEKVSRRAFKRKKMALVIGEGQSGKTWSGKELARRYNSETTYVDTPPSPGKQLMLKVIAKALHVSHKTSFDSLLWGVVEALGPHRQLVIDNFHRVMRSYQKGSVIGCMDMILWLYDQSGCSIVLMATPQFYSDLKEGEFHQYLKQFGRRCLYPLVLESEPDRADLDMLASRYGLPRATGQAEQIMNDIAKADGFGKFCMRIEDAVELAEKANKPVSWEYFIKAHGIAEKLARATPKH